MKVRPLLFVLLLAWARTADATPITIVNTGPVLTPWGPSDSGLAINNLVWLAAEFSVPVPVTVTSIEGWIGVSWGTAVLQVAIADDLGEIPGADRFSWAVGLAAQERQWTGVTNIDQALDAGTYWVVFRGVEGEMTSEYQGASFPLGNEASWTFFHWAEADTFDIPVRILGEQASREPVPEPASLLLLGTGLVGLARLRRRRT